MALRIFIVWKEEAPPLRGISVRQERKVTRVALWAWDTQPGDVERGKEYADSYGYRMFLIDAPEDKPYAEVKADVLEDTMMDLKYPLMGVIPEGWCR